MKNKFIHYKEFSNDIIERQLKREWRVGEACVSEYKVKVVKSVGKDGRVTSLSDGYFETSYLDMRSEMFPVTVATLSIARTFEYEYNQLNKKYSNTIQNWPDIARKFKSLFTDCCGLVFQKFDSKDDFDKAIKMEFDKLKNFVDSIVKVCENAENSTVEGINLFRR